MSDQSAAKPRAGLLTWALWGVALIGVAAVVYIMVSSLTKPALAPLSTYAKGELAKFVVPAEAGPAPDTVFYDATGREVRLADFKGKVVVLNLWAQWCGPCKVEMPTLAALKAAYATRPLEVVAVSIDRPDDVMKARAFMAKNPPLAFYSDPKMALPFAVKPAAVYTPTTIIYGRDGRELGRIAASPDWSGKDAKALIDRVLAEK